MSLKKHLKLFIQCYFRLLGTDFSKDENYFRIKKNNDVLQTLKTNVNYQVVVVVDDFFN